MESFIRMAKLAPAHDKTLGQRQITKSIWEEIKHRAGLANRSEGGNNESPDAPEHVEGISLIGVQMDGLRRSGFWAWWICPC